MLALFVLTCAVALGIQILDIMTTRAVLDLGGHESHPIMAWLLGMGGWIAWTAKIAPCIGFCWVAYSFLPLWMAALAISVFTAPFVWAVWHNVQVIKRMEF